jgi:hypothetical protein
MSKLQLGLKPGRAIHIVDVFPYSYGRSTETGLANETLGLSYFLILFFHSNLCSKL